MSRSLKNNNLFPSPASNAFSQRRVGKSVIQISQFSSSGGSSEIRQRALWPFAVALWAIHPLFACLAAS